MGLPGHHDEGCREVRGVVRRGSWAARTISAVALSSTDGDVLAVEPVIGRLVHREGCRHHYLGQSGINALLECLDENTHNSADEGREPETEEGFLLEPPKLAELGEDEVVVNILPVEGGITTFLDRRHICTDPLSVFLLLEYFFGTR